MIYLIITGAIGFASGGWPGMFIALFLLCAIAWMAASAKAEELSQGKYTTSARYTKQP